MRKLTSKHLGIAPPPPQHVLVMAQIFKKGEPHGGHQIYLAVASIPL
jgi:hypothetical protein